MEVRTIAKRRYSSEEIIHKLREADFVLGRGKTIAEAFKQLAIIEYIYVRWRKGYVELKVERVKLPGELEAGLSSAAT